MEDFICSYFSVPSSVMGRLSIDFKLGPLVVFVIVEPKTLLEVFSFISKVNNYKLLM